MNPTRNHLLPSLLILAMALCSAGLASAQSADSSEPRQQADARRVIVEQENPPAPPRTPREMAELRGNLMMVRKQYGEAIEVFKDILKAEPRNASVLNKVGMAYFNLSNLEQAKKYYERAIKADKNFADAYNNLGVVWYQRKKYRRAAGYYLRALELRPEMASLHSNLGYAYFGDKKYDRALASFQRALELDPQVLERRGAAGGSLFQDRTVEQRAEFFFFVAKTYALQGNAERCAHYLRRAHDDGYKILVGISKDPAFTEIKNDPLVQEFLQAISVPPPAG